MTRQSVAFALLAALPLCACHETKGKDELANSPQERSSILEACTNGTHGDPQECSNAKSVENAKKLEQSLGR
ncbi:MULTISPECIES: EexN family lipoprotein [Sphingomonadaceae]|uniref:EexN family lipoprotein n=1 Tax=Sphingomonadales TaxID=204457 RepID=UPI000A383091|nr:MULTISPECIES: EexN family lipoprotein [Sphingomonadaceae]MEA3389327.1 EexN family lipoprotein [Pseudomonadota bacterium]PHQ64600.1 MAG: hypothetical protein COC10_00200 [Sphingobium sp.]MBD3761817.1 EexN family lipoprotein [Rhizorhabdus sp.]MCB4861776.1 EexN family lipoprotein [Sphingobium sp. PNB]WRD79080.1 EexN family lipoprotein [Sphingobium baderi]